MKCYPIVGLLSTPVKGLKLKRSDLIKFKGLNEVPSGRVDAPIYIGIKNKILDVSYGGKEMYGVGGPYHLFSGIDASRALAKMSFEPEIIASHNLDDLTPTEQKTLNDWEKKFIDAKKYPVVGELLNE